jgi:hypothetical protein
MVLAGALTGCSDGPSKIDPRSQGARLSANGLAATDAGTGLAGADAGGLTDADASADSAETRLAGSSTSLPSDFGSAVAVSGDLLVSTSPYATVGGGAYAGLADVFRRDASTGQWTAQKELIPLDSAAYGEFGLTVTADGDTVAVGAPSADVGGVFQQGAVYVFARHQGGTDQWGQVVKLADAGVGFRGHFGASVAVRGDLLAVGATMPPYGGKVMIFQRDRGGPNAWGKVATLLERDASGGGINEAFGSAVAIDGDLILVGANMADVSYYNENDGAAYLFSRDAVDRDRWTYVARLAAAEALACTGGATLADLASNPTALADAQRCARESSLSPNDALGGAVALAGDTAVVGALCAEGGNSGGAPFYCAGAAYVFRRDPTTSQWRQEAKLVANNAGAFSYFGGSVALAGNRLLVGAQGASVDGKFGQGQAFIFQRDPASATWSTSLTLTASDGLGNDGFGTSVALSETTTTVGAPRQLGGRGAVYLYETPAPPPPTPPPCQPLVAATDTLQDGSSVTSATGLVLGAPTGAISQPAPLYIRDVPAPAESLWDGAAVVGTFFEVGVSGCSVGVPSTHPLILSLPVPEGVHTDRLAVAVLVPGSALFGPASSGRFWDVAPGAYDEEHRLYQIALGGLLSEGITFVLVEDPNLASSTSSASPAPSGSAAIARRAGASAAPTPWFWNGGVSTNDYNAAVPVLQTGFTNAYNVYQANGFPLPSFGYLGVHVVLRPWNGFPCDYESGGYNPFTLNIVVCLGPNQYPLDRLIAHELFHAIQKAYGWGLFSYWVVEATAELAAGTVVNAGASPAQVHRDDLGLIPFRPIDVSLLGEGGLSSALVDYQAQDFWAHLLLRSKDVPTRNFPLGKLGSFFQIGYTTSAVATRLLPTQPNQDFQPLGDEFWAWAKNQVMEKDVTFDGKLQAPCQIERPVFDQNNLHVFHYPSDSSIPGSLDYLQAQVVQIFFASDAAHVTVRAPNGSHDFVYKVYLEGETDSQGTPRCETTLFNEAILDGERTFDSIAAGKTVDVVVANKGYASPSVAPLDYVVEVVNAVDPQP